jgi:hypothetical protein
LLISPIFFWQLFSSHTFFVCIIWQKNIGKKADHKLLEIFATVYHNMVDIVVNFINILQASFAPIFLRQKLQSQTVTREKLCKALLYEKVSSKMLMKLMKLTPFVFFFSGVLHSKLRA